MKAPVWLTASAARTPGSGRGACSDAPHQRPAVRFVAENPSAAGALRSCEPETGGGSRRTEESEGEKRKTRAAGLHFWGLDLFQVALGVAQFDKRSMNFEVSSSQRRINIFIPPRSVFICSLQY